MMVSGRLVGLDRWLARATAALDRGAERGMARASKVVADQARAHHAYQNRTHDLQTGTRPVPVQGRMRDGNLTGGVVADTDYASYLENNPRWSFLWPAWLAVQGQANAAWAAALDAAFKGLG